MATLKYLSQYFTTTLNVGGGIDGSQTTGIILQSVAGVSDISKPGQVCVSYSDPIDTGVAEWINYTSINGSNELVGVTRGCEGYSAHTHLQGATVAFVLSASHHNDVVDLLNGTEAGIKVKTAIYDANGNEVIKTPATTSAVNEFTDTNAATGNAPERSVTGDDTNIDMKFKGKGTGQVKHYDPYISDYVPVTDGLRYHSMARQAIMNGNFDVWQRGTSIAWGASVYGPDRWLFTTGSGQPGTLTQQDGTGVSGSQYSLRSQRTAGALAANTNLYYALESRDSIKLRGKKLTLSFWAKCGANFSPTSSTVPVTIVTGKGTDQKVASFTTSADAATLNAVITTSWQKFTISTSAVIASDITQIGLNFTINTTGTAGANDWFEITQVQLCAGDVALPFQPKSFEEELRACMRYCWQIDGSTDFLNTSSQTTTTALCNVVFPIRMRIPPSIESSGASGANFTVVANNNLQNITTMPTSLSTGTEISGSFTLTCSGAGLVAREAGVFRIAANKYIRFVAEL